MYTNISTDENFPKTLQIRNTYGGMIWQIYHVNNLDEAELLSKNASGNGFYSRTLVDYENYEETFPNWRNECNAELKAVLTTIEDVNQEDLKNELEQSQADDVPYE